VVLENVATPSRDRTIAVLPEAGSGGGPGGLGDGLLVLAMGAAGLLGGAIVVTARRRRVE
jgi:hypothetical protein